MDDYTDMVLDSFERYELETFLIGIRPPEDVLNSEEQLWEEYGIEWTEPIKTELSRLIGKKLEEEKDIEVDFKRPDINAVVDMQKDRVELQVNSLLIYGQYNKYSREIPQTEWPCNNCHGSGCDECDWTGKQYQESVQEIIQEPFIQKTKGIDAKFHGGGREDINVKCFGKREFVLEIREPLKRDLDLKEIQENLNSKQDKVEVFNLKYTHKDKIEEIKEKRADKTYKAEIHLSEDVNEEKLADLEKLVGEVEQDTPNRVEHRRADKTRKREVKEVSYKKLENKKIELKVKAEAGTYIKELIHGDEGRTQPNVADLLDTEAECKKLDVMEIEK
ncbi:MAG: tRNA pseudouridine(54/55) synthase Pus10 [Candidatus Nanohaloarchaea archaeon]